MDSIIGYCGIVCSDCPILNSARTGNDAARNKIAEMLTRCYGRKYELESIHCDGCPIESPRLWGNCKTCEIRKCARERRVKNCDSCIDYRCEKLLNALKNADAEGEDVWNELRRDLG